jgi:hypothetical protein
MGSRKMLVVLALVLAVVAQSAPITEQQEQLLSQVSEAGQTEAAQEEAKTAAINKKVDKQELQLKSNERFAQSMSAEVKSDAESLDTMKTEENQSIEDAKQMDTDAHAVTPSNLATEDQNIEHLDADATSLSNKIQSQAEKLDQQLQAAETKMRNVGISDKLAPTQAAPVSVDEPGMGGKGGKGMKKASLGESQDSDYQDQLSQAESTAEEAVSNAKDDEQQAGDKLSNVKNEMASLKQEASQGLQQLEKSEARLKMDLNGHTDAQLEKDIMNKAHDLEALGGKGTMLGESPLEAAEKAAEQAASGPTDGVTTQDPTPAMDAPDAVYTGASEEAASFDDSQANQQDDTYEAPDMAAQDDQQAVTDLSAIESDAKQLESYQQSSISELEQIAQPLQ